MPHLLPLYLNQAPIISTRLLKMLTMGCLSTVFTIIMISFTLGKSHMKYMYVCKLFPFPNICQVLPLWHRQYFFPFIYIFHILLSVSANNRPFAKSSAWQDTFVGVWISPHVEVVYRSCSKRNTLYTKSLESHLFFFFLAFSKPKTQEQKHKEWI